MGVVLTVLPAVLAISLIIAVVTWAARAPGPPIPPRVVNIALRALEVWLLFSGGAMLLLGLAAALSRPEHWAGWGSAAFGVVLLVCGLVTTRARRTRERR